MEKIAVYPGTFDPLTMGHFDLLRRSASLFDKVIVVVAGVSFKATGMFDLQERMAMIRESAEAAGMKNVEVDRLDCLLVDYCRNRGIGVVVRGLRVYSDFEYEFQMALMNRRLNRQIETVFLMTGYKWFFTSSALIKEAACHGGSVKGLVPEFVFRKLQEKYSKLID